MMMTIPERLPSRVLSRIPDSFPRIPGGVSSPYDTGHRLGIIQFTGLLIPKYSGIYAYGDSWLVEARNLTTGDYSTVQYELGVDGEVPNSGFVFVLDESGGEGDPYSAGLEAAMTIDWAQPDIFDITANQGEYANGVALEVLPGWCIVRVEAVNNISGNMAFKLE